MGFFDFESAEREERGAQFIQGRGDTIRSLVDHRWLSFAIITLLLAIILQIRELLTIVAFVLLVLFVAWMWSRSSLRNLVYRRTLHYRRYFPDETFSVEIMVENRKLLPIPWLHVEDEWPVPVGLVTEDDMPRTEHDSDMGYVINTYSLQWFERIRRHYDLVARRRGVFQIGPAHLVSGDPFSLFDRRYALEDRHEVVIVYPRLRTLDELGLPLKDPFGDNRVQRRLFEDPNRTMGIRDYRPEDSFRHVHWKASAHTGTLQTRVYEPVRSLRTVLCINVATFEQYWRGVWPDMLEYTMEVAASLANWAIEEGHSVGMAANGTLAHADQPFRIPPSRDRDQLPRILAALAAVSYFISSPFDRFLIDESPRLPWGATLVLITPFVTDLILGSILRLRDSGRHIVLISLSKAPPPEIPGIMTHHLPISGDEVELSEEIPDGELDTTEQPDNLTPRQRYLLRRAREEADRDQSAPDA